MFCIILAVRNICFHVRHEPPGFSKGNKVCSLWGSDWIFFVQHSPIGFSNGKTPRFLWGADGLYIVLYLIIHSIPDQSMWNLWWTEWHWERCFCKHLIFPLLVSFCQCTILIVIFILALQEGQTDEAWEPAKRNALSEIGQHRIEKSFQFSSQLVMDTAPGPPCPPPPSGSGASDQF